MRVAILGMGAIGHVVARALEGRCDLVKVDRTRAPLRDGEAPVRAAIVCVKTFGTRWAAETAARLLAPDGVAVTVQNGLGNVETLAAALGEERVSGGVIYVGAALRPDGSLFATGPGRVEIGRPRAAGPAAALEEVGRLLTEGGMTVTVVDDPWPSIWRKVAVNAAMNPTTALFSCTNGELLDHPAGRPIADELAREAARVARAAGVGVSEEEVVEAWQGIARTLGENRSSMLQDVSAGRRTEIDAICGAVAREGARRGVATPLNEAVTILVEALGDPARAASPIPA